MIPPKIKLTPWQKIRFALFLFFVSQVLGIGLVLAQWEIQYIIHLIFK
jgi:hypothetical protein